MDSTRSAGGCLCGGVRYEACAPLRQLCYCHCNSCRRAAGAPMVAWGTVALAAFRVTRGALTQYRSSPAVLRGFCAACGTGITYRHEARAAELDVTLATLDEPGHFAPRAHVWVAERLPWLRLDDGLPQYPGAPPVSL